MEKLTIFIFPQLLLSSHITRLEFFHVHMGWSCFQPRITNATATTTEQNKQKTSNNPITTSTRQKTPKESKQTKSVSQHLFHKQKSIKSILFLNKIPQHPFRASISASFRIIQRGTTSDKCSSPEFFLGWASSSEKSFKPYLLLLYWGPIYQLEIMFLGLFPTPVWHRTSCSPTSLKAFSPYYTAL